MGKVTVNYNTILMIEAPTKDECRQKMFELFGGKWASQYDTEPNMEPNMEKYWFNGRIIDLSGNDIAVEDL